MDSGVLFVQVAVVEGICRWVVGVCVEVRDSIRWLGEAMVFSEVLLWTLLAEL